MHCCNAGTCNAEANTQDSHGDSIEEDTDKEAESNDGAAEEDAEGRARGEEEAGSEDCEGEDKATCDLVDRCIDILEGIVARTGMKAKYSMSKLTLIRVRVVPQSHDIQTNHGDELYHELRVYG